MFSSCKDEGGNGGGPTDLSQQIVGVYKGDMRVEVPLLSYDRTSLQKIYLTSSGNIWPSWNSAIFRSDCRARRFRSAISWSRIST